MRDLDIEDIDEFIINFRNGEAGNLTQYELCEFMYLLALEYKKLNEYLKYLHGLIPMKYKLTSPEEGQNPFITVNCFKNKTTQQDYADAKKRMEYFLETSKIKNMETS